MKRWSNLPILLLQLPFNVRLAVSMLAFLICQVLLLFIAPITHEASIIVIPIALAAWFFRFRGALFFITLTILTTSLMAIFILQLPPLSTNSALFMLISLFITIIIGSMVAYLRSMVDVVEAARRKAILAEQQIQEAYEQQKQLLEQKDLFLMNINHELRSPLTVLNGSLELLKQAWGDDPPLTDELQMKWFNRAVDSCENLMRMTNQALSATFVSHDMSAPHFEEVPVKPVIQELLDSKDPRIGRLGSIGLELADKVTVWADREYLRQILWNVLSNASLYCPPGTAVTISAIVAKPSSLVANARRQLCIYIRDQGPGIPPEEIPQLFSPFVRLKRDVAKSHPGSGLGLYISKRLAEAMEGRIWIESSGKAGEGTCFCLTLPTIAPMLQASMP